MNAPDTNLLLYAYNSNDARHSLARAYWEEALAGGEAIGIPIISVHGFLRISTSTAFGSSRISLDRAFNIIHVWLRQPHVSILQPGANHWRILQSLAMEAGITGARLTDAAIAAIAIEYGAMVHSADSDFARFPGVRWHNPLQS